jgi:predicted secreted protein
MDDARSQRIVVVAHCLLNQNAKVPGLATHRGTFSPLVPVLEEAGVGIVQLPCPELTHLGPSRPLGTDTVEQYDTPEYRAACLDIARRAAAEAAAYQEAGYRLVCVLGVEGSPSCSVSRAPHLVGQDRSQLQPGMGIFMEVLQHQLEAAGLGTPFLGIPESEEAGHLGSAMTRLRGLLAED